MAQQSDKSDVSVLLYYRYVKPRWSDDEVSEMISWQEGEGIKGNLSGRVRVSCEGLNVNLSGTTREVEAYCTALSEWRERCLDPIDFKLAPTTRALAFRGLKVWRCSDIVGLGVEIPDDSRGGRHISPQEFHKVLESSIGRSDIILLDARNLYETRLGHFEVAAGEGVPRAVTYAPPTATFAELPKYLDNLPTVVGDLTGKTILMYCTGGVRCERASQYLISKHPQVVVPSVSCKHLTFVRHVDNPFSMCVKLVGRIQLSKQHTCRSFLESVRCRLLV
jgi:predicted sulfurtransferase